MADSQVLTSENNKISCKLRVIHTGYTGFGCLYTVKQNSLLQSKSYDIQDSRNPGENDVFGVSQQWNNHPKTNMGCSRGFQVKTKLRISDEIG